MNNSITLNGTNIQIARPSQIRYSFGEKAQKAHFLNSGGEILGFVNAITDYMDELYPVCVSGFHSKVAWESLPMSVKGKDQAYVNFDMLTDKNVIERLTEFGIVKLPGKVGWLRLDTSWGRFIPASYTHPKTSIEVLRPALPANYDELGKDEQKTARNAARLATHPDTLSNNEHQWAIVHKHNGLSLVLLLITEKIRVECNHTKGFEWQDKSIESKIVALFADKETRQEKRVRIVNNLNERATVARGGFYVHKYTEAEARVDEAVSSDGLFAMTKSGELVEITPHDLVKRSFALYQGELKKHDRFAFNLDQVKGIIAFAMDRNFTIHLA